MAKSIKLKNNNYIDSTGVTHNRALLSNVLTDFDNRISSLGITTTVLYNNSTGSTTSVTLSDNVSNYNLLYIELTAKQYTDWWHNETMIIASPSNKSYDKSSVLYSDNNKQIYVVITTLALNNNTITISQNHAGTVGASNSYWGTGNCWAITKVIGYKW